VHDLDHVDDRAANVGSGVVDVLVAIALEADAQELLRQHL
jgi:hypothetical protein